MDSTTEQLIKADAEIVRLKVAVSGLIAGLKEASALLEIKGCNENLLVSYDILIIKAEAMLNEKN